MVTNLKRIYNISQQICQYGIPIRETVTAKLDEFSFESVCAIFSTVINQIIPLIQMFMMGKDSTFISHISQIAFNPVQLIIQCRRVIPG